jgi:hypothetical protein
VLGDFDRRFNIAEDDMWRELDDGDPDLTKHTEGRTDLRARTIPWVRGGRSARAGRDPLSIPKFPERPAVGWWAASTRRPLAPLDHPSRLPFALALVQARADWLADMAGSTWQCR